MRLFTCSLALAFALTAMFSLPLSVPTASGPVSFVAEAQAKKPKTVNVKSYTKKNGTTVKSHKRSK